MGENFGKTVRFWVTQNRGPSMPHLLKALGIGGKLFSHHFSENVMEKYLSERKLEQFKLL